MSTELTCDVRREEEGSFFPRSLVFLAFVIGSALLLGHLAGRTYKPRSLSPDLDKVASADRYVLLFGNSRFEAGIDPNQLSSLLSKDQPTTTQMFTGGGWDALHYYMLAILAKKTLRPNRDVVVIEASPLSVDDNANRLGTIRPEAALQVASLQGEPTEIRLGVLLGAICGLYRYRVSFQSGPFQDALERIAGKIGSALRPLGLVRDVSEEPAYRLVPADGRGGFVIARIEGDVELFRARNRRHLEQDLKSLQLGEFKLDALRKAVELLRKENVDVVLVQTPLSTWYQQRLDVTGAAARFYRELESIEKSTGARILRHWPSSLHEESNFWDDSHMSSGATKRFSEALAQKLSVVK